MDVTSGHGLSTATRRATTRAVAAIGAVVSEAVPEVSQASSRICAAMGESAGSGRAGLEGVQRSGLISATSRPTSGANAIIVPSASLQIVGLGHLTRLAISGAAAEIIKAPLPTVGPFTASVPT